MINNKIIQIIPQLNSGGAERFVVDLCNELNKSNPLILITLFPLETHGFYLKELNSDIKVISMNKKVGKNLLLPIKLYKILKNERPAIVHTHLNAFYYCLFSMLFFMKNIKFFHTIHNSALVEAPGKLGVFIKKRIFMSKICTPITISKNSLNSFIESYGFSVDLIENGRSKCILSSEFITVQEEIASYKKTSKTKVLINIARLTHQKNQILLIDSFNDIINQGYDIILILIGANRDDNIFNYIIENSNNNIYYLGEKSNPIDYLYCADAFCLSSLHEGMPISLIEALMCNCIPICTPAGGIVNMIENNKNGFLSLDFTKESYAKSLGDFLDITVDKKSELIFNIKKNAYEYSIERCNSNYLKLFFKNFSI